MKVFLFCSLAFLWLPVAAQHWSVGDKMPNLTFKNVINYKSNQLSLDEFKHKAIIFAFWGINCISCLEAFSKYDSLQKKFKDNLQIIMVNKEGTDTTAKSFARRKKLRRPDVPFITADTILWRMFPHFGNPFSVWVDTMGFVRYTPDGNFITLETLSKFISGKSLSIKNHMDQKNIATVFDKPWDTLMEYYALISRSDGKAILQPELRPSYNETNYRRINCPRATILTMYQTAFDGLTDKKFGFLRYPLLSIFEIKDSSKYFADRYSGSSREKIFKQFYNYQLLMPEKNKSNLYEIMKTDLDRYFDFDSRIEYRTTKCFVLFRTSKTDKLKSKGGPQVSRFFRTDLKSTETDSIRGLYNQPFEKLSERLKYYVEFDFKTLFVDSTGYRGNIDFEIKGDEMDALTIVNLRATLKKYDLDLVEKKLEMPFLVISEKNRR
jgi:thiol-disulfide isomerase/thioredoxin